MTNKFWVYQGRHGEMMLFWPDDFVKAFAQMNEDDRVKEGDEEWEYEGSESEGRVSRDDGGKLTLVEVTQ
jgi:hypothetical protein